MRATFTLDELRTVEDFLDDMAASGATFDEMRGELSARILGHELRERCPDLSVAAICEIAQEFMLRKENTR